jgi:tRNA(fMet)-specific endonuclease VapC
MTLHVLDTDILTLLQERHVAVQERVASCRPEELAITIISVEEQLSGWYRRLRTAKRPAELAGVYQRMTTAVQSLSRVQILSYTEQAIQRYEDLRKLKLGVRKMDLRIAAIVLEQAATLVTRNIRDFQGIPGLKIEDWSK